MAPDQPHTLFELFEQCKCQIQHNPSVQMRSRCERQAWRATCLSPHPTTPHFVQWNTKLTSAVARHPNRALFTRRSTLPGSTLDEPKWGQEMIPTSYAEIQRKRDAIGSALLALERAGRLRDPAKDASEASPAEITFPGIPSYGPDNRLKNGARRGWAVGIWCKNREEWQIVDFACHAYGLVGVSYYETLGPDVAQYM